MATKAKKSSDEPNVTRIKASDTPKKAPKTKKAETAKAVVVDVKAPKVKRARRRPSPKTAGKPFVAIGRYFKGAWVELRQVRWPTRGATWSLTFAVLLYSAFFVVVVLLLDLLFKYLFDLVLGK